jgi:uncharacterized cofD-like protein
MLRGLKKYSSNITAIVTMADDGGSSGALREHGMLPPGDLRNCIAALAESEPMMISLFQHRFEGLGPLKGHSVGNLIMAAMCEMEGDYEKAVQSTSKVLAIRGRVLPSTLDDIRLGATLHNGDEVLGQNNISKTENIACAFLIPETPRALPAAVRAIEEAEVIIIGPGSLFTSLIPNLLVPEIAQAIKKSRAPKIYVCNVMTQPGETSNFKASDHVAAIIRHIGQGVITHALVNNGRPKPEALHKYEAVGAGFVEPDEVGIEMLGVRPNPRQLHRRLEPGAPQPAQAGDTHLQDYQQDLTPRLQVLEAYPSYCVVALSTTSPSCAARGTGPRRSRGLPPPRKRKRPPLSRRAFLQVLEVAPKYLQWLLRDVSGALSRVAGRVVVRDRGVQAHTQIGACSQRGVTGVLALLLRDNEATDSAQDGGQSAVLLEHAAEKETARRADADDLEALLVRLAAWLGP